MRPLRHCRSKKSRDLKDCCRKYKPVPLKTVQCSDCTKSNQKIGWSYLAVEQGDNVVVVQLGQLLQDLDLLAQQVLALGQVLLRDRLDGHHIAWCL